MFTVGLLKDVYEENFITKSRNNLKMNRKVKNVISFVYHYAEYKTIWFIFCKLTFFSQTRLSFQKMLMP